MVRSGQRGKETVIVETETLENAENAEIGNARIQDTDELQEIRRAATEGVLWLLGGSKWSGLCVVPPTMVGGLSWQT